MAYGKSQLSWGPAIGLTIASIALCDPVLSRKLFLDAGSTPLAVRTVFTESVNLVVSRRYLERNVDKNTFEIYLSSK